MIIVAGMGRCGTTTMCFAFKRKIILIRNLNDYFYRNDNYPGTIFKTHDLPPRKWVGGATVVYMFGNPMDIVVSAIHNVPLDDHADLSKGFPNKVGDIFELDVLGLEHGFDAWYQPQQCKFMTVKYEKLWSNIPTINKFFGVQMDFPKFIPRSTNWKRHLFRHKLQETYGPLAEKVERAEDCKVW